MIAVSLNGYKKSGKTLASVELCKSLKERGLKVGAAKFSAHGFDREGTDTSRLLQVCDAVTGISGGETAVFWKKPRHLQDLLPLLDADVLVVEGGKLLSWLPRVLLLNDPSEAGDLDRGLALAVYGEQPAAGLPAINDPETLADLVLERGFALPGLDCGECGREDCAGLAREIVSGEASIADCRASASAVSVTVGGVRLAMNPFVEGIVSGTIRGMLGGLKGYAPGSRVEIVIGE
jgi:molybdopterin-guanine dinucleotide biosynthesis protein B